MKNGTCNFDVTSHGKNVPGRMLKSGTISLLSDITVVRNLPNQQQQSTKNRERNSHIGSDEANIIN
jgi:hypothetical protein